MARKIFISYRRDDVAGDARGIRDTLVAKLGRTNVFMDVDDLLAGQRFDQELSDVLARCDVLIAVIGSRWIDLLSAKTSSGDRDYVRAEIAAALERGIIVIPVLIGRDGSMPTLPRLEELPEDVRTLVLHQKHDVAHERFGRDVAGLIKVIRTLRKMRDRGRLSWRSATKAVGGAVVRLVVAIAGRILSTIASVLAAIVIVVLLWRSVPPKPDPAESEAYKLELERVAKAGEDRRAAAAKRAADELDRAKAEEERKVAAELRACDGVAVKAANEVRCVQPGTGRTEWFWDCQACPQLVVVPSGSFMMGSREEETGRTSNEGPRHRVAIPSAFAVSRFAVSTREWNVCVNEKGCEQITTNSGLNILGIPPRTGVSWNEAQAFVKWLSQKTGKFYRLLTEAEREYVTRARSRAAYWWGPTISKDKAKFSEGAFIELGPVPVDAFHPNPWGLYQVHGNMWEWVQDCWRDDYEAAPRDGSAWTTGRCTERVVRGGSWRDLPARLRAASRDKYPQRHKSDTIGFRIARALDKVTALEALPEGSGFIAVLSTQKSHDEVVKALGDLQQKYPDVLSRKTRTLVQSVDRSDSYRAAVGPLGTRETARGVCERLKSAGYDGCWVATY